MRNKIVEEARSYMGVRWKHQGRTHNGIDCVGLVIKVGNTLKLIDYDTRDYQRHSFSRAFLMHFRQCMYEVPIVKAQAGDVILFQDNQFPCHSAILAEKYGLKTIIHSHASRRRVVEEQLEQGDWLSRQVACFSYVKGEY